ncbi:MAG: D-alanine--D-alanine ligase [Planctomycetes bacterium]|nr:D-alanine--D-alanine ligase [Planctomycetota bacterium]
MLIGFTYDLIYDWLAEGYTREQAAEFDKPDTIDGIAGALESLGHTVDRIGNFKALAKRVVSGERWDLVFNIAEGMHGIGREAQVPALLDAYEIPYTFSDVLVSALTLHKGQTKRVVRDAGVPTADFHVVTCANDVADVRLPYPLFAKPVAEGTGKGISAKSRIANAAELRETCVRLLAEYKLGVLVETYLPGREFTVGIGGTGRKARVLGMMEVHLGKDAEAGQYGFANKDQYEGKVTYDVPDEEVQREAGGVALGAWRAIGCRDAGRIDVRADATGRINFIEVNPLAGLNPVHSDLPILCGKFGLSFRDLIGLIVDSASERI